MWPVDGPGTLEWSFRLRPRSISQDGSRTGTSCRAECPGAPLPTDVDDLIRAGTQVCGEPASDKAGTEPPRGTLRSTRKRSASEAYGSSSTSISGWSNVEHSACRNPSTVSARRQLPPIPNHQASRITDCRCRARDQRIDELSDAATTIGRVPDAGRMESLKARNGPIEVTHRAESNSDRVPPGCETPGGWCSGPYFRDFWTACTPRLGLQLPKGKT